MDQGSCSTAPTGDMCWVARRRGERSRKWTRACVQSVLGSRVSWDRHANTAVAFPASTPKGILSLAVDVPSRLTG